MTPFSTRQPGGAKQQQGMALVISLLFLMAMTMVGVAGMQGTVLEEKMIGNLRDRNLAFSAAEAALRAGESLLPRERDLPDFNDTGIGGFYKDTTPNPPDWKIVWSTPEQTAAYSDHDDGRLAEIAHAPRFVIEELSFSTAEAATDGGGSLGINPIVPETVRRWYRVTARGTGMTENAVVILQSIYRR